MGTRNLICVYEDGDYKVAQYCQWDGYPEGQGFGILNFMREEGNLERLRTALKKFKLVRVDSDNPFFKAYDERCPHFVEGEGYTEDKRTEADKHWFTTYISRDLGSKVLNHIVEYNGNAEILLKDSRDFAGDSLFCEWAYVIDFDKMTFETYKGFNTDPVPAHERFANAPVDPESITLEGGKQYQPVRHVVTFDLRALPTNEEFLSMIVSLEGKESE